MKGLYYFTIDQRLEDNSLLDQAVRECDSLSFCAKSPKKSWGTFRQKFHWESLQSLKTRLKEQGHKLFILDNPLRDIDLGLFDAIYVTEMKTDYEVKEYASIPKEKKRSHFNDRLLVAPPSQTPDVFTEFRKLVEKGFECPSPKNAPPLSNLKPNSLEVTSKIIPDFPEPHSLSAFPFEGGEESGKKRLNHYLFESEKILTYKKTRNGMIGTSYSTKFSPFLALGNLSPITIFHQVERFEAEVKGNQDTYWVKFELWWREYFRWVFEKYPNRFFSHSGIKNKAIECEQDEGLFAMWVAGETQNSFINAFMREIAETGFMGNRGRQIVASYLVNDLKLPWWWGADYFEEVLIDYDVYSNWGNWQYVAGVGNDPRPNRYFHPGKQEKNYDPDGEFKKLWAKP